MQMDLKEFEKLLFEYYSGEISEENSKRLWEYLKSNTEFQDKYEEMAKKMAVLYIPLLEKNKHRNYRQLRPETRISSKSVIWNIARIAAILLVIIIPLYILFFTEDNTIEKDSVMYYETEASYSSQSKVILPDSTVVWLNSGSKLLYNSDFGKENRTVENDTIHKYTYDNLDRIFSEKEVGADNKWIEKQYKYSNGNISKIRYSNQSEYITTKGFSYQNGIMVRIYASKLDTQPFSIQSGINPMNSPMIFSTSSSSEGTEVGEAIQIVSRNLGVVDNYQESFNMNQEIERWGWGALELYFQANDPLEFSIDYKFINNFLTNSSRSGGIAIEEPSETTSLLIELFKGDDLIYSSDLFAYQYYTFPFQRQLERGNYRICFRLQRGNYEWEDIPPHAELGVVTISTNIADPTYQLVWELNEENNMGIPTKATTGNLTRTYGYDAYGLPTARTVKNGNTTIQDFAYNFNRQNGNLNWRKDVTRNKQEDFTYDNLNRLKTFNGYTNTYDIKGNITAHSGIGSFEYNTTNKPYAVSAVAQSSTVIPVRNQQVTYNALMRPVTISENGYTATFAYNSYGDRERMIVKNGNNTILTRHYIGAQYEAETGVTGNREFLYLDGDAYSASSVYVKENNQWNIYYICRDYLGNITHIVNQTDSLTQELSYDPWGRLRNPTNQQVYAADSQPVLFLHRGYTGHEHLPWFGLINMNARLYDPVLGRFLSPDPYVQMPDFSQNYNRYSYALNNPLRYTDPNGEFIFGLFNFVIDFCVNTYKFFKSGFNINSYTNSSNWQSTINAFKIDIGLFLHIPVWETI